MTNQDPVLSPHAVILSLSSAEHPPVTKLILSKRSEVEEEVEGSAKWVKPNDPRLAERIYFSLSAPNSVCVAAICACTRFSRGKGMGVSVV
jgi:hypothetical protein